MVRAVVTSEQGGVAVSWTGNTLTVTDGADFPRDGGQFIVEGDPTTVYSYSLVTDGATEDDPDIITTVDPAPAGLPAGGEFRLSLWPTAVSSVAEVALPESTEDTVPAIIPHALKPYLPDGVRDPEDQEAVIIGQRDMAWVVVDILDQAEVVMAEVVQTVADARAEAMEAHGLASAATTAAQDAHNEAVAAQDTADDAVTAAGAAQSTADAAATAAADAAGLATSKADVFIQTTAPAAAYQKATTLWIDTTGGANTPKRWNGSAWVAVTDKAATDAAAAAAAANTAATNAATAAQAAQDEAEDALAAAATAQYTVDNLQVGGRNLLLDSAGGIPYHSGGTYMWVQGVETPFGVHDVVQYTATGAASLIRKSGVVQPNVEYTFSFWAKAANAGETAKVAIDIADVAHGFGVTVGVEWVHISTTATYTGSNPAVYNFVDAAVRTVGVPVYIALWKLERGNKATDWTPAPEDVDAAIAGKVTTFYGTTTPTATATGDMWIDTTTNRLKRWNGSTWADVTDPVLQKALTAAGTAQSTADGKVRTFAQTTEPTGMVAGDVGDLWVDTDDGNKLHRYSGSAWVPVQDAAIAAAKTAADNAAQAAASAAGIANGKADVLIQSTAPAAAMQKATTLWIDTTGGLNTPKRWSGSAWVEVTDKAAKDAAAAAAAAQTTASNAATAAANAQTAADNAAAAAAAAQTAAGNAQTAATNAMTSANGRNSRVTSTSAPSGSVNPNTGLAWVDGDTWWQWDSTSARNVIGAWTRRAGAWSAEAIGHQVVSSMDLNKLLVTGSAYMAQAVVDKIVGDAAYYKLFTADRIQLQAPGASVYYDGTFNDPGLSVLRASNNGWSYNTTARTMTGTSTFWLTYNGQDEGVSTPLLVGQKYRLRVWGTGLTSGAKTFARKDDNGYVFLGGVTYTSGLMEVVFDVPYANARVNVYAQTSASATITRVELVALVGGTVIEPGGIDTPHLKSTAIDGMVVTGATVRTAASGSRVQLDNAGIRAYNGATNTFLLSSSDGSVTINGGNFTLNGAGTISGANINGVAITGSSTVTGATVRTASGNTRLELSSDHALRSWQNGVTRFRLDADGGMYFADSLGYATGSITPDGAYGALGVLGSTRLTLGAGAGQLQLTGALTTTGFGSINLDTTTEARIATYSSGGVQIFGAALTIQLVGPSTSTNRWQFEQATVGGTNRNMFRYTGGSAYMAPTSLAANLHMDANGRLYLSTSSASSKVDIRDVTTAPERVLDVPVRDWYDRTEAEGYANFLAGDAGEQVTDAPFRRIPGVVAEELVDAGLSQFVTHGLDGQPNGVMYDRLTLLLIPLVRDLRARLERLENNA